MKLSLLKTDMQEIFNSKRISNATDSAKKILEENLRQQAKKEDAKVDLQKN